jgi:hypothetical protein
MNLKGESNSNGVSSSQIIYKGQCINNDDPMRLGRIRAISKTENRSDREIANENFGKRTYRDWDEKDPFIFKPLLPFFINTPPKVNEYVHLFYNNITRKGGRDKYYIGGVYSSPTMSKSETYNSAVTNLEEGTRNKPFTNLLNEEGEYFYEDVKGVYSDPNDITLYGRGSCDIVIKDNTVLLRAGKNNKFENGQVPRRNEKRSFLQLSKFDSRTVYGAPKKKYIFVSEDKNLKVLVEYNITNPENNANLFAGEINIYNLAQADGLSISTASINVGILIPETSKSLLTTVTFSQKSMSKVKKLINDILEGLVKSDIRGIVTQESENIVISGPEKFDAGGTFPFYFRPQNSLYKKLGGVSDSSNAQVIINVRNLISGISIRATDGLSDGYSLVYDKDKTDSVPFKPTAQNIIPKKIELFNKSVGVMGGDEIYLLSHNSQKFGTKSKIDLSKTIYGIDENTIADEIEPKTSAMVRGEELIDLLNLIVRFLIGHVHPYPGIAPVPTSTNGITIDNLLEEILNAQDKILNKNIRIN